MAMIACGECQGSISSDATACPHCGKPQPGDSRFRCDKCFVPNDPYAQGCRNCGASLDPVREREARDKQGWDAHRKAMWAGYAGAMVGFMVMLAISISSGAGKASCAEFILAILGLGGGGLAGYYLTCSLLAPANKEGPQ